MQYNRMTDKAVNDLAEFDPQEALFLKWKTRINLLCSSNLNIDH